MKIPFFYNILLLFILAALFCLFRFFHFCQKKVILTKPERFVRNNYPTCTNLSPASYDRSFGIKNDRIAIVMAIANPTDYADYVYAINTTQCYAIHFGYQMHFINLNENEEIQKACNQTDLYFKRHCAVAWLMEEKKKTIDYVLYLDADMGVINPCHTIQEYLQKDDKIEMMFYERYFNEEIAAGSYLIKNTEQSKKFLRFWADYFYRLPQNWNGGDNGAIHQVFMELHFSTLKDQMQCYHLWNTSKNNDDLQRHRTCVKYALFKDSSHWINNTVKIVCKLEPGWVRDAWLTKSKWSSKDFMFHGMKKSLNGERWQWPFSINSFDLNMCQKRSSSFQNFKHNPLFIESDKEIKKIIIEKITPTKIESLSILKSLNLIPKSSFKYNLCK